MGFSGRKAMNEWSEIEKFQLSSYDENLMRCKHIYIEAMLTNKVTKIMYDAWPLFFEATQISFDPFIQYVLL